MTVSCNSKICPRRESCGRHDVLAERAVDYSHGDWFDPDHCFFWKPIEQQKEPASAQYRVGNLYAGGWP